MDNITIFGQADKHLHRTVELLQKTMSGLLSAMSKNSMPFVFVKKKRRVEAIAAEKLQANRMGKEKQKATGADKRKDNALGDLLHHRTGVVIRDELEISICEEKRRLDAIDVEKLKGTFMGKGKQNAPYANRGQENSMKHPQ